MADLTLLSTYEPMPIYPVMSRPHFSSSGLVASSSSRRSLPPTPDKRLNLSHLDLSRTPRRTRSPRDSLDSDEGRPKTVVIIESPTETQAEQKPEVQQPEEEDQESSATTPRPHPNFSASLSSDSLDAPTPRRAVHKTLDARPTRHRPSRSRSAPPGQTRFLESNSDSVDWLPPMRPHSPRYATTAGVEGLFDVRPIGPRRGFFTAWSNGSQTKGGELLKPPPPLHRPTTFWRRTPRSGVTSSSYSPSTHLIRRSTFVAAGLPFDKPMYDVSASGVENRLKTEAVRPVATRDLFWEVVAS